MLFAALNTASAVCACSFAKPLCTKTVEDTPGKSVLSRFSMTTSISVKSESLQVHSISVSCQSMDGLQFSRISSFVGDDDCVLRRPIADIICFAIDAQ